MGPPHHPHSTPARHRSAGAWGHSTILTAHLLGFTLQVHGATPLSSQHTCWASLCRCMGLPHHPPSTPSGLRLLLPWHSCLGRCLCAQVLCPQPFLEAQEFVSYVWSGSWSCPQPPTFPSLSSLNEKQGPEKSLSPTLRGLQAMPTGWLLVVDSVMKYLGWVMVTHSYCPNSRS